MKQITEFETIPLGVLPTPMYKLENLSRELGKNIYIKRDDMTGVGLGGNKVRKLEFLLAEAKAQGADVILTAGGPQSNHAMLTAACAARLGMEAILILKKRGTLTGGNLILDGIFGASVRMVDTDSYEDGASVGTAAQPGPHPVFHPCGRLRACGLPGLCQLCPGDRQPGG